MTDMRQIMAECDCRSEVCSEVGYCVAARPERFPPITSQAELDRRGFAIVIRRGFATVTLLAAAFWIGVIVWVLA